MSDISNEIKLSFLRDPRTGESKQEQFFYCTKRNICFSGGYGNGKSYAGCQKILFLLSQFPKYRVAILRASSADLRRTTMSTFFKLCPPAIIDNRADSRNYLRLINGSEVFWLHLDEYDENLVRGLELNAALVDQAEEIGENIYLHLDSRVGRWDMAEVPEYLGPENFPKNPATGKAIPPSYMLLLCNPDGFHHWIYKRYHPDSMDYRRSRWRLNRYTGKKEKYSWSDTHIMFQASSYENPALADETLMAMEDRGEDFVKRFVRGEWGFSGGTVFTIAPESKVYNIGDDIYRTILSEGRLYRCMDHGDASPTVVLWFAVWKKWIFFYREYYMPNLPISQHRKNISHLSRNRFNIPENYTSNFSDPAIFKKTQQKKGGIFSLADEYLSSEYDSEKITWVPADNDEFITRAKVREALRVRSDYINPFTLEEGSPKVFFLMKNDDNPNGINRAVLETEQQKYKKLGIVNGNDVWGDERDNKVTDHAYDALKYGLVSVIESFQHDDAIEQWRPMTMKEARKRIARDRKWTKLAGLSPYRTNKGWNQ